ncbi:TadE/TadG family type IV pilus assembly protein [Piscinibacter sp.]|uniref:TadE/TadG family type IV pilus assembly protein n=1 Tax=Piscinibacter sp. TaxID=1903157 RepID=UPI002CC980A4|nr:TadE/TadG family type IV pilus assembly protein [Albitalea sp.]HUG26553.1 TadE/TadG family type IV pilus assembly protein [Albitalea sp.]
MKRQAPPAARRRLLGVAAVEFGIMLAPLLAITFGVTEYGRAIYTYNALDKSVRDAARHLTSVLPTNPDPETEAKNLVVYGSVNNTGSPLAPGLTTAMVSICNAATCPSTHASVPTGTGAVNLVTVRISGYTYTSIVTYVAPATLDFSDISVTMRSHL